MSVYRVKQFYWSMTAKITNDDISFIHKYLEPFEINLFNNLLVHEQKHSVNVARDIKTQCKCINKKYKNYVNTKTLVKVALLHDIGKIKYKLSPVDKSVIVVLDNITNGKIKKYNKIKKINSHYNHAEIGYNILKQFNYDDDFLYLIRNHHENNINNNIELQILKLCDDKN